MRPNQSAQLQRLNRNTARHNDLHPSRRMQPQKKQQHLNLAANLFSKNQARLPRIFHAPLQAHGLETRMEYARWQG
jgi:hypothetical protein